MDISTYWRNFLLQTNRDSNTNYISCDHFELTESLANELLRLVLIGQKKATCSSLDYFKVTKERIPQVGDLSIITDWDGNPRCIIETTDVLFIPYKEISFEICSREGEDANLESWQDGHARFFTNEGKKIGYSFHKDMIVVFEGFEVVYKS